MNNSSSNDTYDLSLDPPGEELNYEGALQYLFSSAKQDAAAVELCAEIDLSMDPPIEMGVLQYLFRLQAIGRIEDWPLLFGAENTFIVYLLDKVSGSRCTGITVNEKIIWDIRRKETEEWLKQQGNIMYLK